MANTPVVVLDDTMTSIANAIRTRTGGSATMTPGQMPAKIAGISDVEGYLPREVSFGGTKISLPSSTQYYYPPTGANIVGYWAYAYAFNNWTSLKGIDFSGITTVEGYSFFNAFSQSSSILAGGVQFPDLTDVAGDYAFSGAMGSNARRFIFSFPALTTITGGSSFDGVARSSSLQTFGEGFPELVSTVGNRAFENCCSNCTRLTTVSFPKLRECLGTYTFYDGFRYCSNLTSIDFSKLETAGPQCFYSAFENCTSLTTVSFPALNSIGKESFASAFRGCSSSLVVSFPALNQNSFGSNIDQFKGMFTSIRGATVHFPASVQSIVETLAGYPNFGGTNTTVLFDL